MLLLSSGNPCLSGTTSFSHLPLMVGTTMLILEVCASDEMITKLLNCSVCGLRLQNFISLLKTKKRRNFSDLPTARGRKQLVPYDNLIGHHVPAVGLVIDTGSSY